MFSRFGHIAYHQKGKDRMRGGRTGSESAVLRKHPSAVMEEVGEGWRGGGGCR